ncbi:hypothetical protein [Streptomyces fuscichromogenes]|nr:hypothetical protein [Streptomyces fuscichromogenes]
MGGRRHARIGQRTAGGAPSRTVVPGLVSSEAAEPESADTLRRRIDEASPYIPLEQPARGPRCGFAATSRGNPLTADDQRRRREVVAETARLVWG